MPSVVKQLAHQFIKEPHFLRNAVFSFLNLKAVQAAVKVPAEPDKHGRRVY